MRSCYLWLVAAELSQGMASKPYACDLLWRGLCAFAKRHRAVRSEQPATGACFLSSHGSSVFVICSMSAQDIWARKYHELWEKLEKNTKDSFCTALWKWIVSVVNQQCSLSDHAQQSHHCCLVAWSLTNICTHRLAATIRAMTQQYIQLSSVCCSLRTYRLKALQRTPKIPLEISVLLEK